jgi:glycosyltransferase involved in cell wall biosynthesis
MSNGISVIICCHNGATRLPKTLAHLRAQEAPGVPWELLIIDNASTDGTAEIARSYWVHGPAPSRVVRESKLGLQNARERGLAEAAYDYIGFVDDDNWVARDWVLSAYRIMSADPVIGALGSVCDPVCEVPAPQWFGQFHLSYAILPSDKLNQTPCRPSFLNGAGLCVRKMAWQQLLRNGFRSVLTDRIGNNLAGGGDTELTHALRLSGWKLLVEPSLRLQHYMPAQRLRWTYLRHLQRGYSASNLILDAYTEHSLSLRPGPRRRVSECWWYQFAKSLGTMAMQPSSVIAALWSDGEGQDDIIKVEQQFGRALELLRIRARYGALRREIREAPWRHLNHSEARPDCRPDNLASTV